MRTILVPFLACAGSVAFAQTPPAVVADVAPATVTVQADNTPIANVAASITQQSKTRVLIASGTGGRVTLHLEKASVETAVKTTALLLGVEWRALWLSPEVAPRIRADEAARLVRTLAAVGNGPLAVADGRHMLEVRSQNALAPGAPGLRAVYVLFPKDDPAAAGAVQEAPMPPPMPQIAPSNDPEVMQVQRAFAGLSVEQQRAFMQGTRSYYRGANGRGNGAQDGAARGNRGNRGGNNQGNRGGRGGRGSGEPMRD